MVFIAGPRQVGKTTLAKEILKGGGGGAYYLWDNKDDRREIMKARWPVEPSTVVLDEIHKYKKWKRWVKGEFDKHRDHLRIIVTGSARLDVYRKGGDSLQGRYHHYRLHPFSVAELAGRRSLPGPFAPLEFSAAAAETLDALLRFSGFPEPALARSERVHRRWQKERVDRFFREDVRDLEAVREMSSIQLLSDLVPEKVGSPLSLNSLREDLDASHKAVAHWMDVLERLYFVFKLRPFTAKLIRSLKKGPKYYLWDWSMIEDPGARFENMVASHLLKFCHLLEDAEGHRAELHYLRDEDKREVDFLVTVNRKPWFAVEAKLSDTEPAAALRYFGARLEIPFLYQVVRDANKDFESNGVRVIPAAKFLAGLV
ncbi:MAG: ATP-binding protein [Deltaproteobacteria bacterium]|nr:ATP-binding protein [Deltaproteobacteria bacterium]